MQDPDSSPSQPFHFREVLAPESRESSAPYHAHEVLHYEFANEKRWSRAAAARVKLRAKQAKRQQAEALELERQSRWYNASPSRKTQDRNRNGPRMAQRRIRRHVRRSERIEAKRKKAERKRWYTNRQRLLATTVTMEQIRGQAGKILKEMKLKREVQAEEREAMKAVHQAKIKRVEDTAKQALGRSRPKEQYALEMKLIRREQPPFYPGPYMNAIESSYGREQVATPRRTFQASLLS